jgi:hypothetical protein
MAESNKFITTNVFAISQRRLDSFGMPGWRFISV